MRKLLILALLASFNLNCHQMPVKFWLSNEIITDNLIPELNVDIDQFSVHDIPCGTYRLSTNNGLSNKYVKMVIDGKISRISKDFVCFYISDGDGGFMRIACIDMNSGDHDFNIML
jgi:hypothetical protein